MQRAYGDHVIYLMGGALLRESVLVSACQALRAGIAGATTASGNVTPSVKHLLDKSTPAGAKRLAAIRLNLRCRTCQR
jgi:hypothetical protein